MSLADELDADTTPSSGIRCSVCVWYSALPGEDRATFDQWIVDGNAITKLHRAALKSGLTTGLCQFQTHVNGIGGKHVPR